LAVDRTVNAKYADSNSALAANLEKIGNMIYITETKTEISNHEFSSNEEIENFLRQNLSIVLVWHRNLGEGESTTKPMVDYCLRDIDIIRKIT
jgi:hypothetical protein